MRRFFVLTLSLALLLGFFSCGKAPVLSGEIALEDGTQLMLYKPMESGQRFMPYDSTLVQNGHFEFRGEGYEEGLYGLVRPGTRTIISLYLSDKPTKLVFEEEKSYPKISGGKHQKLLSDMYVLQEEFEGVQRRCRDRMIQMQKDSTSDREAISQEIETEWSEAADHFQTEMFALARENRDNPISLDIYWNQLPHELEEMLSVKEELAQWSEEFQGHPIMTRILDHIAREERLALGCEYIDFSAATADGDMVKLSDVVGKNQVVLVEFWASWCRYCRQANPGLVKVYKDFHSKGFEIFGFSLDRDHDAWKKAVKDDGLPWPQYVRTEDGDQESPADLYNVQGIPFNVLLDQEGKIVGKSLDEESLRAKLQELLK